MRKTFTILLTLCAFIFTMCANLKPDETEITQAVIDVLRMQQAEWNKANIEGFMEGYWQSEELTFASGGGINRGWQSVLERYKTGYTPETMGQLTFSDLEVTVLGVDAALCIGSWDLEREPDNPGGTFSLVFRKFPDGWRIIHDHTSNRE